jgi:hypothetical protein
MTGKKSGTLAWYITPKLASAAYEAASPAISTNGSRNGTRHKAGATGRRKAKTKI